MEHTYSIKIVLAENIGEDERVENKTHDISFAPILRSECILHLENGSTEEASLTGGGRHE